MLFFLSVVECGDNLLLEAPDMQALPGIRRNLDDGIHGEIRIAMYPPTPPANPDIKRELKKQLLGMSARSFEFFAGDFLVYIGLTGVSVTRFIGDGGIDAQGDLMAGMFRIPTGIQVKRYRNNVQRPDIEKFIGALSGRFSQGMFMTTANYAPSALQKASTSIPRILTLNGDQIVSVMIEHQLGLKTYTTANEQTIDLKPENDLISLNALGYALRVDPNTVRRWIEHEKLRPDASQTLRERSIYYFRRDRIEQIRESLGLENIPTSSDEWKQEFLDFAKSRNLSRSYKPVMVKAFFKLVDREGKVKIDDLVREFRDYYAQRLAAGEPLERDASIMARPTEASNEEIKRLLIDMPVQRFLIKNFIEYLPDEGVLRIAPQLWRELHYYEVVDVLKSADEQISYYVVRHTKKRE